MKKFSFTCTCGDVVPVDANAREEAVEKIKAMMGDEAIAKHMADKHPGQPVPTKAQSDVLIEQMVQEVVA